MIDEQVIFYKIIKMFRLSEDDFLNFNKDEVIQGPNDRAMFGFDTYFPILWLVEDYGFTLEEAKWFVGKVRELHDQNLTCSGRPLKGEQQ